MSTPLQTILYGPPGAGKSTKVRRIAREREVGDTHLIETTFYPDYTYGDFVAKIMPMTLLRQEADGRSSSIIRYQIQVGPFIKALALALQSDKEVLLVIDEINRGNGSAIFGDIFQLLDRNDSGESTYGITLGDLVFGALMKETGWTECEDGGWMNDAGASMHLSKREGMDATLVRLLDFLKVDGPRSGKLRLPANLSIVATMNTSDESVYVMDTAFKRRWNFEFIPWDYANGTLETDYQCNAAVKLSSGATLCTWHVFLTKLNAFIAKNAPGTRLEDKLVGLWFVKAVQMPIHDELQDALDELKRQAFQFDYSNPGVFGGKIAAQKKALADPADQTDFADLESKLQKFLALCKPYKQGEQAYSSSILWNDLHNKEFPNLPMRLSDDKLARLNNVVIGTDKWTFRESPYPRDRDSFKALRGAFFAAIIDLYRAKNTQPVISPDALQYKLLHFIWDNIFYRDKDKLSVFIGLGKDGLRTFDQFLQNKDTFLQSIFDKS